VKIYTKIVIDMETLEVIEAEWTEYTGPIGGCKGGGGGQEVDKDFNKGMLAISEKQQDMADEMFNLFKFGVTYDPGEKVVSDEWKAWKKQKDEAKGSGAWAGIGGAERFDEPEPEKFSGTQGERQGYDADESFSEMELINEQLKAQGKLLPLQTEAAKSQLETIGKRQGLVQSIYEDALAGVDVEGRVGEHRAGVQHAFKGAQETAVRDMSRMGIDPSSGRGATSFQNIGLEKAKATAAGETQIRRTAEDEDFRRKATAAGLPV
jgi:hypothetical protein